MADLVLGLAKSAVEGTLTMAKTAIEEEAKLKKGVQRDLMLISDELEIMHSVLNVSKDHITDDVTRTLVRQVRNMALDVEDCIESGVHLEDKSRWWRSMLRPCVPAAALGPADLDAAVADIELVKARVEAMGLRNMRYSRIDDPAAAGGPKPTGKPTQQQQPVVANATASNALVMVREAAKKENRRLELAELITMRKRREAIKFQDHDELLFPLTKQVPRQRQGMFSEKKIQDDGLTDRVHSEDDDDRSLQVISVLGTVGTMSIIERAYVDPDICKSFVCRAWVKLMHPFSSREFILSLLVQFYRNGPPQMKQHLNVATEKEDDLDLIDNFTKQMSNLPCSYLVVLEDVCTMVDWESVRVCLPDLNNGSTIVVNTHQEEVAALCVGYPHRVMELEKLSADYSVYALFKDQQDAAEGVEEAAADKRTAAREWRDKNQLVGREMDLSWLSWGVYIPGRVVSVWGMSGVGKSFLVKHVQCRLQIDNWYPGYTYGWVNVSYPFDLMDFSRSLLLDLNPGYLQYGIMATVKDPIQACREYLHNHNYIIVMDGLQSMEEWDSIKVALGLGSTNGRIIVITNEEGVAKHCATHTEECVWNVQSLGIDHAIELWENKAQRGITLFEEERRIIVHKCGGLPKVICVVAGLLAFGRLRPRELTRNLVSLLDDKAAFLIQSLQDMFAWLLSYFHSCPDFLKPCIFYLTIFPLTHTIRRRRLVRRWTAEGYARDSKESTAEENGEMSYSKLVNLSMIQVPRGYERMPPLCQFNGFLREYIISRSMEENFVFALEGHCSKSLQRTGRHLAIDRSWDRDRNVFQSIDFSRLRSLTVFGYWRSFIISEKMTLLRVLDLEDVSSGLTDGDVERMVKLLPRLKFLSLRKCRDITRLPDSLGDLKQLQTLDIRGTSVVKLPKSIIKLEKLQYIRAGATVSVTGMVQEQDPPPPPPPPAAAAATLVPNWLSNKFCVQQPLDDDDGAGGGSHGGVKVPRGIGKLSNLHTLGVINIGGAADSEGILEEFKGLTQLHKFGVSGVKEHNSRNLVSAISNLAHLESLSLHVQLHNDNQVDCLDGISEETINNLQSLKLYGLVHTLPRWTRQLGNLRKLSLQMTMLPQHGIDILGNLQSLRSLRLFISEFQDDKLQIAGPDLNLLEISSNSRLKATIIFHGRYHFILQVLRIRCPHMSSLRISGVEHRRNLKEVWLSGPCDNAHKLHFQSELAKYPERKGGARPVLRMEEPGSSIPWLFTSS